MLGWLVSFIIVGLEVACSISFFDTFLVKREEVRLRRCKPFVYYIFFMGVAAIFFLGATVKLLLGLIGLTLLNCLYYNTSYAQSFFFSELDCAMGYLFDYIVMIGVTMLYPELLENSIMMNAVEGSVSKIFWLFFMLLLRKIRKLKCNSNLLTNKEWIQLSVIPGFTLLGILCMDFFDSADKNALTVYQFLLVGLIGINLLIIYFMQNIVEKEQKIRAGILMNQNQKNQLEAYQEMEGIYERQRKKMHDYKNQLGAIQTLIKGREIDSALTFVENLTESISVDMSAVNTSHPVINAVLNQKYHSIQEKNLSLILKVGDLHEVSLEEEEIVILLSNLLDNAIRESEKVYKKNGKAVINLKLVYEDESMILVVRNPVLEKVAIVDDMVQNKNSEEGHGIGLLNVKMVVDKRGGDMVLSCDDREFKAIVVLSSY